MNKLFDKLFDKPTLIRIEYIGLSVIISIICYFFMKYYLNQSSDRAWGRSIIISSILLIYFVLFGYDFPPKVIQSKYI